MTYRYLVFAGDNYYPRGPSDFHRSFQTLEEAKTSKKNLTRKNTTGRRLNDWATIYEFDATTGEFREVR